MQPLAQPPRKEDSRFDDWVFRLWKRIATTAGLDWDIVDKTGSNLTDIETRHHDDLQYIPATPIIYNDNEQEDQFFIPPPNTYDFDHITFPAINSIGNMAHIYTLSELMDHEWSAGVVDGGMLTNNGDGTISIAEAVSTIRADTDPHGKLYGVETPAQLNISLTDNFTNYIYLNYAGVSTAFAVTTTETTPNGLNKVLAWEVHRYGNLLHYIDQRNQTVDSIRKSAKLQAEIIRFTRTAGGSTLGAIGLAITLTAGEFHRRFESLPHVAFDTSIAGTANANTFVLWNHVAGVYTSTESSKLIDTTLYDDGTNTALLSLNNYGVSWVYVVNDSPSELHVVMGQVNYAKLADAIVATPPASLPSLIAGFGVLVGFVIYERGVIAFDDVRTAFTQTFGTSVPTQHNGLAGIQTTSALPDDNFHLASTQAALVPTGIPSVGQVPTATSATTSTWQTPTGGGITHQQVLTRVSFRM